MSVSLLGQDQQNNKWTFFQIQSTFSCLAQYGLPKLWSFNAREQSHGYEEEMSVSVQTHDSPY